MPDTTIVKAALQATLRVFEGTHATTLRAVLKDALHCIEALERELARQRPPKHKP